MKIVGEFQSSVVSIHSSDESDNEDTENHDGDGSTSCLSQEVDKWCSNLKHWIRIVSELMHTVEDVIHEGSKIRLPTTGANDTGATTATVPYDEILRLVSDATGMNLSVFRS